MQWIRASHTVYDLFEKRSDLYPIARKWIDEWYRNGFFRVRADDLKKLESTLTKLDHTILNLEENMWRNISQQLIRMFKDTGECSNIGFAIAPYLSTWNIRRFEEYFGEKQDFSLEEYYQLLGGKLGSLKDELMYFRKMSLVHDKIEKDKIRRVFNEVNTELSKLSRQLANVGKNEPIGSIKILHVFAPHYFPLLDNEVALNMGIKKRREKKGIDVNKYLTWMSRLQRWLRNYTDVIKELEMECGESILRLVDKGLYVMCSMNLRGKVKVLGLT